VNRTCMRIFPKERTVCVNEQLEQTQMLAGMQRDETLQNHQNQEQCSAEPAVIDRMVARLRSTPPKTQLELARADVTVKTD